MPNFMAGVIRAGCNYERRGLLLCNNGGRGLIAILRSYPRPGESLRALSSGSRSVISLVFELQSILVAGGKPDDALTMDLFASDTNALMHNFLQAEF